MNGRWPCTRWRRRSAPARPMSISRCLVCSLTWVPAGLNLRHHMPRPLITPGRARVLTPALQRWSPQSLNTITVWPLAMPRAAAWPRLRPAARCWVRSGRPHPPAPCRRAWGSPLPRTALWGSAAWPSRAQALQRDALEGLAGKLLVGVSETLISEPRARRPRAEDLRVGLALAHRRNRRLVQPHVDVATGDARNQVLPLGGGGRHMVGFLGGIGQVVFQHHGEQILAQWLPTPCAIRVPPTQGCCRKPPPPR
jgi:hypothetical protein